MNSKSKTRKQRQTARTASERRCKWKCNRQKEKECEAQREAETMQKSENEAKKRWDKNVKQISLSVCTSKMQKCLNFFSSNSEYRSSRAAKFFFNLFDIYKSSNRNIFSSLAFYFYSKWAASLAPCLSLSVRPSHNNIINKNDYLHILLQVENTMITLYFRFVHRLCIPFFRFWFKILQTHFLLFVQFYFIFFFHHLFSFFALYLRFCMRWVVLISHSINRRERNFF